MTAPAPTKPPDSDNEPVSYFQLEQRRRAGPGEDKPAFDVAELPPQPSGSPWSADPCGPEPTIDRSREDGDTKDMTQE
jgi:hypothetical protein